VLKRIVLHEFPCTELKIANNPLCGLLLNLGDCKEDVKKLSAEKPEAAKSKEKK